MHRTMKKWLDIDYSIYAYWCRIQARAAYILPIVQAAADTEGSFASLRIWADGRSLHEVGGNLPPYYCLGRHSGSIVYG